MAQEVYRDTAETASTLREPNRSTALLERARDAVRHHPSFGMLRHEIATSVREALEKSTGDVLITPLAGLIERELRANGFDLAGVEKDRLFLDVVAEQAFMEFQDRLTPLLVHKGADAGGVELKKLFSRLTQSLWMSGTKRDEGLRILQGKFKILQPELVRLLDPDSNENRIQRAEKRWKAPGEGKTTAAKEAKEQEKWRSAGGEPELVDTPDWHTPELEDIDAGLILEIDGVEYHVLGRFPQGREWFARLREPGSGKEKDLSLSAYGITSYRQDAEGKWARPPYSFRWRLYNERPEKYRDAFES